jgi:hypothetical protein
LVSSGHLGKKRPATKAEEASDYRTESELRIHEAMLEALVEELDEKGIIRYSDWEAIAKRKLAELEEAVEDRGP